MLGHLGHDSSMKTCMPLVESLIRVNIVVAKEGRDGEGQAGHGGEQRGGDAGRDGVDVDLAGGGDGGKRHHDADDGAEQAEEWAARDRAMAKKTSFFQLLVPRHNAAVQMGRTAWIEPAERFSPRTVGKQTVATSSLGPMRDAVNGPAARAFSPSASILAVSARFLLVAVAEHGEIPGRPELPFFMAKMVFRG